MWTLALGLVLTFNEPAAQAADAEPPRGRVAVGLGIAGLVAGTPMMIVGGVFSVYSGTPVPGSHPPPIGPIVLGTGIATATLGVVGLTVGSLRSQTWTAWKARHPEHASRLRLAPSGWAGRESFGFVIAGRF